MSEFFSNPQYLWAAAVGVFAAVLTGTLVVWALIHRHERREEEIAAARRKAEAERETQRRTDERQAAEDRRDETAKADADRRAEDHVRHLERSAAEAARHVQIMGQLQAAIQEARRFPAMVAAQYQRTESAVDGLATSVREHAGLIQRLREDLDRLAKGRPGGPGGGG